ncbi:hypothetical protein Tsubulata_034505 [Turnera subulata]|uniref:Uncharacterized protein n=2 Tax=Turnera subulata TaxID=218843 RepID=A0A9Q0JKP1_9ROSI|nr:hypothetical protein Tsubulata_034505 [Turnera subulata]
MDMNIFRRNTENCNKTRAAVMDGKPAAKGSTLEEQQEETKRTWEEKIDMFLDLASKDKKTDHKEIHIKALDDIVNVNSLFTIAVFVGLSSASRDQLSGLEHRSECHADADVGKRLVVYEVLSFACFLLSNLVAKSLKVYLNIFHNDRIRKRGILKFGRGFMFLLSVVASIIGVVFLTLSMANLVQIRVGKLTCGSHHTVTAVSSLCIMVLVAVLIYLPSMLFAMLYCMIN